MEPNNSLQNALYSIGAFFNKHNSRNTKDLQKAISICRKNSDLQKYELEDDALKIIGLCWYNFLELRTIYSDPLEIISKLSNQEKLPLDKIDLIIDMLKKNILDSETKQIIRERRSMDKIPSHEVVYQKSSVLRNDISFHKSFLKIILNENTAFDINEDKPYQSNKEYVSDWFRYVSKLSEITSHTLRYMKDKRELIEIEKMRKKIAKRVENSEKSFPLLEITQEYNLDEKEKTILMFLVKEDVEGYSPDIDRTIKIISVNQHDMYRNRSYLSRDSKLVRNGLVEIPDNLFFRSRGSDVRISPDVTRRIITKTPTTDTERIEQVIKGNDIFTLLEPEQSIDELILPADLKSTLETSLKRYRNNVDQTLQQWGLFDKGLHNSPYKTSREPGLLMLFHGQPGTGKTFASGAIANSLNKKLLITDISRLQSKWVGDSEKNVKKMFTLFERIVRRTQNPPVLLLNEADQFLSQRLANTTSSIDVMYNSLQNLFLEAFEELRGVLIATTNLSGNLDEAFSRRFHLKLEFPVPKFKERKQLWQLHLPPTIPGCDHIDIEELSRKFKLTGGQIKIIVKNAATEAASRQRAEQILQQDDLIKYCELENKSMFDRSNHNFGFSTNSEVPP